MLKRTHFRGERDEGKNIFVRGANKAGRQWWVLYASAGGTVDEAEQHKHTTGVIKLWPGTIMGWKRRPSWDSCINLFALQLLPTLQFVAHKATTTRKVTKRRRKRLYTYIIGKWVRRSVLRLKRVCTSTECGTSEKNSMTIFLSVLFCCVFFRLSFNWKYENVKRRRSSSNFSWWKIIAL